MRIYKFRLSPSGEVEMQGGARVLCVQVQGGAPYLWALVDPERALVTRKFHVLATGQEAPPVGAYIGTFQLDREALVFHVFEVLP